MAGELTVRKKEQQDERILSVQRDGLELRHELPDPCPCMDGHVGIIGNFINLGNGFRSAQTHRLGIIQEQRTGLVSNAPDISGYRVVFLNVLQHQDTVFHCFFRIGHGITYLCTCS